ncbi:MAG: WcaF family extracellular polysaccharide biosynthesis acetyltransferase [bacterium]|nr:WcaF family extracellular polysaccharide biosynthesis acetyltransferase [bacterium]
MSGDRKRLGGETGGILNIVPAGYSRGASGIVFLLWLLVRQWLFDLLPRPCYSWRIFWLRVFGASIGRGVIIRPGVKVEFPWRLTIGDGAMVGDEARLYNLAPVAIGRGCVVSQYAHICTGTHDPDDPDFILHTGPVTLEDGCWVATDAFVGPGVTVGRNTVLGARSAAFTDLPAGKICIGTPARVLRDRYAVARVGPQENNVHNEA